LPLAVTEEAVVASLATHALPLLDNYDGPANRLYARSHIDRRAGIPRPPDLYIPLPGMPNVDIPEPRIRPLVVAFLPVKSCAAGAKNAKYVRRQLRGLAAEFPTVAFAVLDEYAHAASLLRLGFKKLHARNQVAIGILANGAKYSILPRLEAASATEAFNTTLVRTFVAAFVAGDAPRYFRSDAPKARGGVVVSVSASGLERSLFRGDEAAPSAPTVIDDVVLVALADSHSKMSNPAKWAITQLATEAAEIAEAAKKERDRRRKLAGDDEPERDLDAFLDRGDYSDEYRDRAHDHDREFEPVPQHLLRGKPIVLKPRQKNATAEALQRLHAVWLDGDTNDLPLEHFYPHIKDNHLPVVFAAKRRSSVVFSKGAPMWEVSVGRPMFFQFGTWKLVDRDPFPSEIAELVTAVWEGRAESSVSIPPATEE